MADRYYQTQQQVGKTFGHIYSIGGLVFTGQNGDVYVALLPSASGAVSVVEGLEDVPVSDKWTYELLTAEEMSELLQFSDNPDFLDSTTKIFHRKARFEISGAVQQKVWVRDGCRCMFCKRPMGEVQLSIDHFVPLEMGGKNDPSNYLSACRKCNKDKGNQEPKEFCDKKGYNYNELVAYLAQKGARL